MEASYILRNLACLGGEMLYKFHNLEVCMVLCKAMKFTHGQFLLNVLEFVDALLCAEFDLRGKGFETRFLHFF